MRTRALSWTEPAAAGLRQVILARSGIEQNGHKIQPPTASSSRSIDYPSRPVVLFANVGWLWNVTRDVDQAPALPVGRINPGDASKTVYTTED